MESFHDVIADIQAGKVVDNRSHYERVYVLLAQLNPVIVWELVHLHRIDVYFEVRFQVSDASRHVDPFFGFPSIIYSHYASAR